MKLVFTSFFITCALSVSAQINDFDGKAPKVWSRSKNYYGIKIGGMVNTFAHNNQLNIPSLNSGPMLSWQAGLAMDLLTQQKYNARVELTYTTKGAKEVFENDRIGIRSTNKLKYIQLSALPLIIKPGFRKINPYLGLGAYYARRIGIKSLWNTGQGWKNDVVTAHNLNIKNDFGYCISLGIYAWRRPVAELRYEAGLKSVSSTANVKNRSLILSFSI